MGTLSQIAVNGAASVTSKVISVLPKVLGLGLTALAPAANTNVLNEQLMFPNDLVTTSRSIYINFFFATYHRPSIYTDPFITYNGGIQLPIPPNLINQGHVEYSEIAEGPAGAFAESYAAGQGIGTDIASGLSAAAIKGSAGVIQDTVGQLKGEASNPFLTVLFKAPSFKTHQFTWKLAPRSIDESTTLQKIINQFEYNRLPGVVNGTGGTILSYPNICYIQFQPNFQNMYQFMPTVITDVQYNYSPMGPSFFHNTNVSPSILEMTITFKEIQYWLNNNISGGTIDGTIFNITEAPPNNGAPLSGFTPPI